MTSTSQSEAGWLRSIALCALGFAPLASAQHASDNAVIAADDAFGITVGTETIGLYFPDQVRGFDPQIAGNARVGGLYFDQQAPLSNRVLEGSTIRVGINTIGYAFPAPTGIVDYDLRHPSEKRALTAVLDAGPFDAWGVDLDAQYPIDAAHIQIPVGVSYRVDAMLPGLTTRTRSMGISPQWKPREGLSVRAFWDRREMYDEKTEPLILMGVPIRPREVPARYLGQSWASNRTLLENVGAIVDARLSDHWSLAAGLFRSVNDSPRSYADLYLETDSTGRADHLLIGYPDQRRRSTSGDARVSGHFAEGPRLHEVVLSIRGRDAVAYYDGADVRDVGSALIYEGLPLHPPAFNFTDRTRDQNKLSSGGIGYHGRWIRRGELSLGIQKVNYRKIVAAPGEPEERRSDQPWRVYAGAAVNVTSRLDIYAGYTQGVEDAGIVPSNADNRGEVLRATRTWQRDAGIQYALTPKLKLIAGVFDVHKPYFNLNESNFYVDLGEQRHKGFELSIAGEVARDLNVVAGLGTLAAEVSATRAGAATIGARAIGQNTYVAQMNADYQLPAWPGISLDLTLYSYGRREANADNSVSLPGQRFIDVGARYKFTLMGASASLRLLAQNIANTYSWALTDSGGFSPGPRRSLQAYVTADF